MSDSSAHRVQVFVRCRPRIMTSANALHAAERHSADGVTKNNDTNVLVADKRTTASGESEVKSQEFIFDGVFDQDSTQEELYEYTTIDAVDAATTGYDCTILTYGQTGSGKTYTILGKVASSTTGSAPPSSPAAQPPVTPQTPQSPQLAYFSSGASLIHPDSGLFLRVLHDLLHFSKTQKLFHVVISINVLEVYLDTVRDLLSKDPSASVKVLITEDNVGIPDLTYREINTLHDAVKVYDQASKKRIARSTDSNDASSRSHALFNIDVYRQPITAANKDRPLAIEDIRNMKAATISKKPNAVPANIASEYSSVCGNGNMFMMKSGAVLASRITLTDLAGSERMKSSNSKGAAFDEMIKINGSLTSLGNVVHALYEGSTHIPYRDTRLTVLLRAGFSSAGSKIVLIANIAPTTLTYDETYSTLLFANKVKAMKAGNKPNVNAGAEFVMQQQLTALMRKFDEYGCDLRIFSAAQSPEDQKTKAIVSMIETKRKRKQECVGGEKDPRVEAVRTVSESAKKDRNDALERILSNLPAKLLSDHKNTFETLSNELQQIRSRQQNSTQIMSQLDEETAKMKKELAAENVKLLQLETSKKDLTGKNKTLDGELAQSESQLNEITTITDPEVIALKDEQEELRTEIDNIEKAFTESFTPMINSIRAQFKTIEGDLEVKSEKVTSEEQLEAAKRDFTEESSNYDPVAIKSRVELLETQLVEDFDESPWLLKPEEIIQENEEERNTIIENNEENQQHQASILSPQTSGGGSGNVVMKNGSKKPMFIPPPPSPQFAGDGRSQSCFVGYKKAPPPPAPVWKDGRLMKGSPLIGKRVPPPPPSSTTGRSASVAFLQQQQEEGNLDRSLSPNAGVRHGPPLRSPGSTTNNNSGSLSPQGNFFDTYNDSVRSQSVQQMYSSGGVVYKMPPPALPKREPSSPGVNNNSTINSSTNSFSTTTTTGNNKIPAPPTGYPPGSPVRSQSVNVNGESQLKTMPPPPGSRPVPAGPGRSASTVAALVSNNSTNLNPILMKSFSASPTSSSPLKPSSSSAASTSNNDNNNDNNDGSDSSSSTIMTTAPKTSNNSNNNQHVDPMANGASEGNTNNNTNVQQQQQQVPSANSVPSATATAEQQSGWNIQEFNSDTDEEDDVDS